MNITNNQEQSRFETSRDGLTAVATYKTAPNELTITHVIVPQELRGQGIATRLAEFVVDYARAQNVKIVPQCPFMASFFDRHPDARDVLADE